MTTTVTASGGDREKLDEWFADDTLARAKAGDTRAAGEICKSLADWIENDQPIPAQARKYLIDALRKVGKRASCDEKPKADSTFLLRRRHRGRPWALNNEVRDKKLAIHMEDYLRKNPEHSQTKAAKHARGKLVEAGFDVSAINDKVARRILREYREARKYRDAKPAPS